MECTRKAYQSPDADDPIEDTSPDGSAGTVPHVMSTRDRRRRRRERVYRGQRAWRPVCTRGDDLVNGRYVLFSGFVLSTLWIIGALLAHTVCATCTASAYVRTADLTARMLVPRIE